MPRKALCFMLCITLLIALGAPAAQAASVKDLWVSGASGLAVLPDSYTGLPADAVHWWRSSQDRVYYLFLPTGAALDELTIGFAGADSITLIEDATGESFVLHSGDSVGFLKANGAYTVQLSKKTYYPLRVLVSSGVPSLYISTQSGSVDYIHYKKSNEEPGSLLMVQPDGAVTYSGALTQVKGRGNASFSFHKKSYQIKLQEKTDLIGSGKAKTWVLLANFRDNSLLRNKISSLMAQNAGLSYTSQSIFCDLYVDNDYYGVYELCEKVQVGENRVEIHDLEKATEQANDEPLATYDAYGPNSYRENTRKGAQIPNDPADITGGYLIQLEYKSRYKQEPSGFVTKNGRAFVLKSPEYASVAQVEYIAELVQRIENALRADDGIDPESGAHYSQLIDVPSLAARYLIEEISKNYDANSSSQYFYKDVDSTNPKLMSGPVWDYDSAYANYYSGNKRVLSPEGLSAGTGSTAAFGYPLACTQPDFQAAVKALYYEKFVPAIRALLGEITLDGVPSLDELAASVEGAQILNFKRWPVFNSPARVVATGADYQENIQYLKDFLSQRMAYLSAQGFAPSQPKDQ